MAFNELQAHLFEAVRNNEVYKMKEYMQSFKTIDKHWTDCRLLRSGDSPLHVAAKCGRLEALRFLCEVWKGRPLNLEDSNLLGKKCLHDAAHMSYYNIVEYLIKMGANIDALKGSDWTPLMLACTKHNVAACYTIQMLLDHGANPLLKNKDGWTALHIACREGDEDVFDMLLRYGPESVTYSSYNGRTPLHIAALHGHRLIINRLVQENNSLLEYTDACGLTPLHEAARGGHLSLVQLLIRYGAHVQAEDKMGRSCLHLAAEAGHCHIVSHFLLEEKMPVDLSSSVTKVTALHCALRCGQIGPAKLLLEFGASTRVRDGTGRTARDYCFYSLVPEIQTLLSRSFK